MSVRIYMGPIAADMPRRAAEQHAVRRLIDIHLPGMELRYRPCGAPYIADGYISVTHARSVAAIAVSDRPVGIDLEYPRPQLERIAARFLSESEQRQYTGLPALLYAWTAKEAAFKACYDLGCPVAVITRIRLRAGDDGLPACATAVTDDGLYGPCLSLSFVPQPDGALLAIAQVTD